jgi:pyruvate/2-oxoglutarate dehydrogenase complex dihydrolipoamide acyltransferase (E2) component
MSKPEDYTIRPVPRERGIVVDTGWLAVHRHIFYGLLELDVTCIRESIRQHKVKTGETLSLTAFIVKCLATAIEAHPLAHAYRDWLGRLVIFNDVDVVTMIETEKGGVALPHVVRSANRKTFQEISAEIRTIQTKPRKSEQKQGINRLAPYVPAILRRLFFKVVMSNPQWMRKFAGTVIVTSVGMFGQGGTAWGIAFLPSHTVGVTVGGISRKPAYVEDRIEPREFLSITLAFDHDVIDGAPAARFASKFKELVEKGMEE